MKKILCMLLLSIIVIFGGTLTIAITQSLTIEKATLQTQKTQFNGNQGNNPCGPGSGGGGGGPPTNG